MRLIAENGQQIGLMTIDEAMEHAFHADLDLVEIQPHADPPVCRLLDYGKFRYAASKKKHEQKRKQKQDVIKEIKFRPGTDVGDYDTKIKRLKQFLGEGKRVKVTMRFRGREMVRQQHGHEVLQRIEEDLADLSRVDQAAAMEGRQLSVVLAPAKK